MGKLALQRSNWEVSRSARRAPLFDWFWVLLLTAVALGYCSFFSRLIPLAEFRDWITWNELLSWRAVAHELLVRDVLFSRSVSMIYVELSGAACGAHIACLNYVNFLPTIASAPLLYVLGRQVGLAPVSAAATVLAWLFSIPVVDSAIWQATINDRCALLFSALTLSLALWALARPSGWRQLAAGNLAVGLALVLAYNSKEAAWFVAPSLLGMCLALGSGSIRDRLARCRLFALPIGYAIYHNLAYLLSWKDPAWTEHVAGVAFSANFPAFVSAMVARDMTLSASVAATAGLGVVALLAAVRTYALGRKEESRLMVWLWLTALLAFAIPSKTLYHNPYCMYLPWAFICLALMKTISLLAPEALFGRSGERLTDLAVVALVAIALINFCTADLARYSASLRWSANLRQSLALLAQMMPAELTQDPVVIVEDPKADLTMYLQSDTFGHLLRLSGSSFPPSVAARTFTFTVAAGDQVREVDAAAGDRLSIWLDGDLRLARMTIGQRTMLPPGSLRQPE